MCQHDLSLIWEILNSPQNLYSGKPSDDGILSRTGGKKRQPSFNRVPMSITYFLIISTPGPAADNHIATCAQSHALTTAAPER